MARELKVVEPSAVSLQGASVEDTNASVLVMMSQALNLFQRAYNEFQVQREEDERELRELAKNALRSEEDMNRYMAERERADKITFKRQKNIRDYMTTVVKLAHEYRQCRSQAAYYFHISQFQEFYKLLIGILHQEIHNVNTLDAISKKLADASLRLFPVEVTKDAG